jgi:four helix bundle protein
MDKKDLEIRTKEFAIRIIKFVAALPENRITAESGHQLLMSGTSVGVNYGEANRAESRRDFIHKIGTVEKECRESHYWLDLFDSLDMGLRNERQWLLRETGELLAIFTASGRTAKQNRNSVSDYLIESYETV